MRLHYAKPEDIDTLYEIDKICFSKQFRFSKYMFKGIFSMKNTIGITAVIDKTIVGFAIASIQNRVGKLITIDVLPEYRRKGIGQTLLMDIEKKLFDRFVREIMLEVWVKNIPAIKFYEKNNYKIVSILPCYYANFEDAYLMRKSFSPDNIKITVE